MALARCSKGRGQGQRQDQPRHRDEFEDGDHHRIHAADGAAETGGAHDGQPTWQDGDGKIYGYPLVMTNSLPWKIPTINGGFKLGKSSINGFD